MIVYDSSYRVAKKEIGNENVEAKIKAKWGSLEIEVFLPQAQEEKSHWIFKLRMTMKQHVRTEDHQYNSPDENCTGDQKEGEQKFTSHIIVIDCNPTCITSFAIPTWLLISYKIHIL